MAEALSITEIVMKQTINIAVALRSKSRLLAATQVTLLPGAELCRAARAGLIELRNTPCELKRKHGRIWVSTQAAMFAASWTQAMTRNRRSRRVADPGL